jgi:predicted Zn-dependent protease
MAGQWPDAIQFAERAMKGLPAGSRDAARAQDIIEIAKAQMPESERRGQRRLNPFQPAQAGAAQDTLP